MLPLLLLLLPTHAASLSSLCHHRDALSPSFYFFSSGRPPLPPPSWLMKSPGECEAGVAAQQLARHALGPAMQSGHFARVMEEGVTRRAHGEGDTAVRARQAPPRLPRGPSGSAFAARLPSFAYEMKSASCGSLPQGSTLPCRGSTLPSRGSALPSSDERGQCPSRSPKAGGAAAGA
ncbi:unnamed protein product [Lampetra fluviatilis]